jgi:hypothetical protein
MGNIKDELLDHYHIVHNGQDVFNDMEDYIDTDFEMEED